MSMHEIEGLVEDSIAVVNAYESTALDKRSLFAALFKFQEMFDTGFTHFRVMPALVSHRFVYTFAVNAHPDYARCQAVFEKLHGFEEVYRTPDLPYGESNPTVGYFCDPTSPKSNMPDALKSHPELGKPLLYCDAGSELWARMVQAGLLVGKDAERPSALKVFDTALLVMQAAEATNHVALIAQWYKVGLLYYISDLSLDDEPNAPNWQNEQQRIERLKQNPIVEQIRELVTRAGAMAFKVAHDPDVADPYVAQSQMLRWWLFID